ncbi:hypothetical protein RP20_CCG012399 [Aedes albopictus]|nr:hypothetical protein RP20_CCG012399 [Aedes albopictus]
MSGGHDGVAMASSKYAKKIKCFLCGKLGHKKADCRKVKSGDSSSAKPKNEASKQKAHVGVGDEQPEIAFLSAESGELVKVGWFIDSGATDHMLKDADCFSTLRRLETPVEIVVANGQKLRAEYCGDVSLYAVVGGVTKECVAKNVLYLPGLSCNLFSVSESGVVYRFGCHRPHAKGCGLFFDVAAAGNASGDCGGQRTKASS